MKYTKASPGKDGAPNLDDIVGERFYNLFILQAERNNYSYSNKTYQFRATISQNANKTFKIKTSPINFSDSMPIQPVFEFAEVDLVKLENGAYSFVARKAGTGVFRTVATNTNPEGFVAVRYDDIKLIYAGTEIKVVEKDGKKQSMIKFALDFKQDIKVLPSGWLNVQEVVTTETKGFENADEDAIYAFNNQNKNLILAARQMASSMKGAAGTHCDYRIEFQGYRLKYTGIKTRPYLFNKAESKYKRLPRTKVCDRHTSLKGSFLSSDYQGIKDVKVSLLDAKTHRNILDANSAPIITDANGEFFISSEKYPNFNGGFIKIKFEYKDANSGEAKTSYYPSESDINKKNTIFKMTPNSQVRDLLAQIPDTSIRVKPLGLGNLGISGNHSIYLYKDSTDDPNPKEQKLVRKPAIEGSDRNRNYKDYTATFDKLEAGTYYIKMHIKDTNQNFWYQGTDEVGNIKIITGANQATDAAPIEIRKDQKLWIYPRLDSSLVTYVSFIGFAYDTFGTKHHPTAGFIYDYDSDLYQSNDEIIYRTGSYYRNIISGTKYKIGVKRRICTDTRLIDAPEENSQVYQYLDCKKWSKEQWVKDMKIYDYSKYKVIMTPNKSEAKIFTFNALTEDSVSTPDNYIYQKAHALVADYDESLNQ